MNFRIIHCLCGVLFSALFLCSCHNTKQEERQDGIQTGDLLFVGLPLDFHLTDSTSMDNAITSATGREGEVNYIHVAILERDELDSLWVIDATINHGVDRHPFRVYLADFTLNDGSYPVMDVMRLKDNSNVMTYVENAKTFVGRGYDMYFSSNNTEQYCSELVRNSYITSTGGYIFSEYPMNFKSSDGTFPPYWIELFGLLDEPIPQGELGTNPNAMSQESCLMKVGTITLDSGRVSINNR